MACIRNTSHPFRSYALSHWFRNPNNCRNPYGPCARKPLGRKDRIIAFPWGNEDTQNLIDIFDQYNVKATFFVVGEWVDKYPESVKALADAGHEVMGHSNNHAHFNTLSADEIIADINTCNDKIEAVTGVRPTLFRPPFGEYDDHVVSTVRGMDLEIIQWDVELLAASAMPWGTRVCGQFFPSFAS